MDQEYQRVAGLAVYWAIIGLMMTGLYALIARENLVKKIMGLSLFQSSAIMFYVALAKVRGGTAPILLEDDHEAGAQPGVAGEEVAASAAGHGAIEDLGHGTEVLYSNPLPHVLMLTAIVVGVATLALALAMVVRIQDRYGTVEEDEIVDKDLREDISSALRPVGKTATGSSG